MGTSRTLRASVIIAVTAAAAAHAAPAIAAPYCQGEYAEDLSSLSPEARELEARTPAYSYAVRTSAVYECVAYGGDGNLRTSRQTVVAYGTAFGLRADHGDTLLMTNTHVAEWPAVTDDDHPVDGVPAGCKRVSDALRIVDDDHDEYTPDDIPLTRVVSDPAFDIAILRAHVALSVIPWAIGHSAGLSARDVVETKGFPLGEFRATNVGKVISAYAHDTQGDWSHDDFVVDALLTAGGSGSPVLALSCKTGELELVGVFHARYSAASALNVVVAIDQLRPLMTTLQRTPHPEPVPELDAGARAHLADAVRRDPDAPFFAVGSLVGSVRARADGALVFALFASDFPRSVRPLLVLEDAPGADPKQFGALGSVYVGGASGPQQLAAADMDADTQAAFARALGLMRTDAIAAFDYRAAARTSATSRAVAAQVATQKRALGRMIATQRDAAQLVADLAARVTAKSTGALRSLADIEAAP